MKKKVTLLSAAITAALAAPAFAGINDIIISEYVEGSDNNKAIEIKNIGASEFSFNDDYGLFYNNGLHNNIIETDKKVSVLKDIKLKQNEVAVIIDKSASDALKKAVRDNISDTKNIIEADTYIYDNKNFNSMNFNGDESIFIADKDNHNVKHDLIGRATYKKYWGSNKTFRRIEQAEKPKTTFSTTDWVEEAKDTFSGLGDPTLADKPPVETPCKDAAGTVNSKTIADIQGKGFHSPLINKDTLQSDEEYLVTGVVTNVTTTLENGFYIQSSDGDNETSDGIFVATKSGVDSGMIGQKVCVRGIVKEESDRTQLEPTDDKWEVVEAKATVPAAEKIERIAKDGTNFKATLERYEGMLVKLPKDLDPNEDGAQDMRVSRTFSRDYDVSRNNMVLAYKRPNMHPNQDNIAGSIESALQAEENKNSRLIVESDASPSDGVIPYFPKFKEKPKENYIRINDSVIGLEGTLTYSDNEYRLIATNEISGTVKKVINVNDGDVKIVHNLDRTSKPVLNDKVDYDKFALRIATQNVLNYFNSPFGGAENSHGEDRGAPSDFEFSRQHDKIIKAINGLDADIIGLMEIENNGFGDLSAISQLVDGININYHKDYLSDKKYAFVGFDSDGNAIIDEKDSIGGDVITSGLLYRPSKVTLEYSKVIPMPSQQAPIIADENGSPIIETDKYGNTEVRENGKNYQRNTVTAIFKVNNTGKKLTVAVNHLKSKGSTCWEDWQGWQEWKEKEGFNPSKDEVKNEDFQGNCENFRIAAAVQLGEEMAKMGGDQVVMGDMNSYANEDPMLVLTNNPTGKALKAASYTYIGKMPQFGPNGATITKSYGFLNTVSIKDKEKGHSSWSYSYNDEIGSLDHILITKSLEDKLLDATDWHINAAESNLYDYKDAYKGYNGNGFYEKSPYRSSDHDSAIMALSYKYGETDGAPILIPSKSGVIQVAYPIASKNARSGDIAEISFSPMPEDMQTASLPQKELTKDGAQTVMLDVAGVTPGIYTVTMQLKRPVSVKSANSVVPDSTVTMQVEVEKRDSLAPKATVQPYDGTGGSFGIFGLLSMLGLGFLRRSKK
ncbi:Extracellular deoxyribonuclease Xds [Photobacterium marinum]|uniref:Extracellular deoxyribonuclease Xds n=1 Tax=Photobacterium marinum TaxID=1056511 RepID=L8JB54_9GAMM|nr:ExeM/NucH family extracellular endonuclease [Photobacterium marinum]ELR65483.1 Extracellular deoxyribonuclease Xds [Photobacterium marinum]